MSTTDGQPPLTRRQMRDLERARQTPGSVDDAPGSAPASALAPASAVTPSSVASPSPVPSAPSSATTPPPASVAEPGQLTRRELRALREAEEARRAGPVPLQPPVPEQGRTLSEALSTADELTDPATGAITIVPASSPSGEIGDPGELRSAARPVSPAAASAAETVVPASAPSVPEPASSDRGGVAPTSTPTVFPLGPVPASPSGLRPASPAAAVPASTTPAPSTDPATPSPTTAPRAASPVAPASPASGAEAVQPLRPALLRPATPDDGGSEDDGVVSGPASATRASGASPAAEAAPASVPEPTGFVPPVGHWSTQSDGDLDEETLPGRALGTHTGQTNALILTDQQVADVTGALNATGEIIITGSIDLPRSLGATGSQARIDNSDIDRLLEQGDAEGADTDAAPVRASRAISTHTSTRAVVLAASQPPSSRIPLVLGIVGGVVGLGIIGVVITGFATGILGG